MNSDNMHHFLRAFVGSLREQLRRGELVHVEQGDIEDLETLNYLYWPDDLKPADLIRGWLLLLRHQHNAGRDVVVLEPRLLGVYAELAKEGAQVLVLQKVCERIPIAQGMGGYLYELVQEVNGTLEGARVIWSFVVMDLVRDSGRLRGDEKTKRQRRIERYKTELEVLSDSSVGQRHRGT